MLVGVRYYCLLNTGGVKPSQMFPPLEQSTRFREAMVARTVKHCRETEVETEPSMRDLFLKFLEIIPGIFEHTASKVRAPRYMVALKYCPVEALL